MRPLAAVPALSTVVGDRCIEQAQEVPGAAPLADAAVVEDNQAAAPSHEVLQARHGSRRRQIHRGHLKHRESFGL